MTEPIPVSLFIPRNLLMAAQTELEYFIARGCSPKQGFRDPSNGDRLQISYLFMWDPRLLLYSMIVASRVM